MSQSSPLTESLAELSRFFVGDHTLEHTLHRVAELTVEAVAPADLAGLTMLVEGRRRTAVFTDPTSPEVDQAQYDTGEGPCLEAFSTAEVKRIDSTSADGPWLDFRKAAHGRGINSTLSLPMIVNGECLGAMNLYSHGEAAFSGGDEKTATQFASLSAIVLANAHAYWQAHDLSSRLAEAMISRATIEQAKGVLMSAQRCGPDEAFELLVRASQRENIKLREIARRIVDQVSGAGPEPEPPR